MSFEWTAFLEHARMLAQQHPADEAALRSAASRAYYASFHHAKAYLLLRDPTIRLSQHGPVHVEVPGYLKDRGRTREEKGAAAKLESLKRLRTWADYERTSKQALHNDVQQALLDAALVVRNLPHATGG